MHQQIIAALEQAADPKKAASSARFFKTGKGQYSANDIFIGINVPDVRRYAKQFANQTTLGELEILLADARHEVRLLALLILVGQFEKADAAHRKTLYEFYLAHTAHINNWDLVDTSATQIVGAFLFDKDRQVLYTLAGSPVLWEQRIAIIATFYFIRRLQFDDTLQIADLLLVHPHDLIHKAVGWMLREVGKREQNVLIDFLNPRYHTMPRTMLRYAIERFPEPVRQHYLAKPSKR